MAVFFSVLAELITAIAVLACGVGVLLIGVSFFVVAYGATSEDARDIGLLIPEFRLNWLGKFRSDGVKLIVAEEEDDE